MQSNLTFKLVISDQNNSESVLSEIKCPYDIFGRALDYLPESSLFNDFFKFAALHPAPTVREAIAYKDKLSEEVFRYLKR